MIVRKRSAKGVRSGKIRIADALADLIMLPE